MPLYNQPADSQKPVEYKCHYQYPGDENGILFFIGSDYGDGFFINPHALGKIKNSLSSLYQGQAVYRSEDLSNRSLNIYIATEDFPYSFAKLDLGKRKRLLCNHYTLQGRNYDANHLRNWQFLASNDDASWTLLDEQKDNFSVGLNAWFEKPVQTSTYYRYFMIRQSGFSSSGDQILTLGQWEFYGTLALI